LVLYARQQILNRSILTCRARTKPELVGDAGVEDVLFTAWSGRMIPKAFSPGLPPLVEKARQSKEAAATGWMLTPSRLV
jgi:hypothetical protein